MKQIKRFVLTFLLILFTISPLMAYAAGEGEDPPAEEGEDSEEEEEEGDE